MPNSLKITQLVRIKDLKKKTQDWKKVRLKELYTAKEIRYSSSKHFPEENLTARFAAKKALMKALGCKLSESKHYKEVEILNDAAGRPKVSWKGSLKKITQDKHLKKTFVSLTHTKNYAAANVILAFRSR